MTEERTCGIVTVVAAIATANEVRGKMQIGEKRYTGIDEGRTGGWERFRFESWVLSYSYVCSAVRSVFAGN